MLNIKIMNTFNQIEKEAKKYFVRAKTCHDWEHTLRVYKLCIHIGKKEKADIKILKLAAMLHDIGRPEDIKSKGKICHAELGTKLARQILKKYNLKEEVIEKIAHCIECHRFRNDKIPQSREAKILFDADKLDAIGAVGIGRDFMFASEIGAKFHDKNVDIKTTREYTKEDTAYREFLAKLRFIKNKLMTKEGKRIGRERHKYMSEFFERLNKEVDGDL